MGEPESVCRPSDMDLSLGLKLHRQPDGDIIVTIGSSNGRHMGCPDVEICTPGAGGSKSPETWRALGQLFEAMQADATQTAVKDQPPGCACLHCGSLGPFRDVVYPNTPNGPEEYDVACVECGSLDVAESAGDALRTVTLRLDAMQALLERCVEVINEYAPGMTVLLGDLRAELRHRDGVPRRPSSAAPEATFVVADGPETRTRIEESVQQFTEESLDGVWRVRAEPSQVADAVIEALREVKRG